MLSNNLVSAINNQIQFEHYSAFIYKSMEAYFATEDLPGMANWMNIQFQEEMAHAEKMFHFVCETGNRVVLQGMDAPHREFTSPLEVFEIALEHEQIVTARINALMDLAQQEKTMPRRFSCSGLSPNRLKKKQPLIILLPSSNELKEMAAG